MRYIFIFIWFYSLSFINAQSADFDPDIIIKSSLDTTNVQIGEKIIYTIDIASKNKYNIRFDEKPNFIPFEILDSFSNDSIIESSNISKKIRDSYSSNYSSSIKKFETLFNKNGAGIINCKVDESYVKKLLGYFKHRA